MFIQRSGLLTWKLHWRKVGPFVRMKQFACNCRQFLFRLLLCVFVHPSHWIQIGHERVSDVWNDFCSNCTSFFSNELLHVILSQKIALKERCRQLHEENERIEMEPNRLFTNPTQACSLKGSSVSFIVEDEKGSNWLSVTSTPVRKLFHWFFAATASVETYWVADW